MAGLNNLLSNTQTTSTTLPAWYDQAQQNIINQGNTAAGAAPQLNQTVAQGAINTLQPGASNPFTQAQGTLQQISSGAANPWITDASGNVTPDTSTAMGGLFQAQDQQLNQLMPNYTAPVEGAGIASGNFGSLRGMTAVDKAKTDAMSTLDAQQMQSALTNQQTGSQAAANLGSVAGQGISSAMNVGTAQQNAPFQTVGNQASLLGTLQAPTTVNNQTQMSPLGQIATLGNAVTGGTAGLNSLLGTLGVTGGLSGLFGSGTNSAAGNSNGTSITGTGSTGDVSASSPTLPDGSPNPNYDAYASGNQAAIDAQNAANQTPTSPAYTDTGALATPVDPYADPYATITP